MRSGVSISRFGLAHLSSLAFLAFATLCGSVPPPLSPRIINDRYLLEQQQQQQQDSASSSSSSLPPHSFLSRAAIAIDANDSKYIPARIGGIVGSYGLSLLIVGVLLLVLSRRRREHLKNGDLLLASAHHYPVLQLGPLPHPQDPGLPKDPSDTRAVQLQLEIPSSPQRNFSYPGGGSGPLSPTRSAGTTAGGLHSPRSLQSGSNFAGSPVSTIIGPARDLAVDQAVVTRDKAMAQAQLEDMYRFVMEHDQAKAEGREYDGPPLPSPAVSSSTGSSSFLRRTKDKTKNKPSSLNLHVSDNNNNNNNKRVTGAAAVVSPPASSRIFAFLRSPRRSKTPRAVSISSPIVQTPRSGAFPNNPYDQRDGEEVGEGGGGGMYPPLTPRYYVPMVPPPVPASSDGQQSVRGRRSYASLPTPEMSPVARHQSLDTRHQSIDAALGTAKGDPSTSPLSPMTPLTAVPTIREDDRDGAPQLPSPVEDDSEDKGKDNNAEKEDQQKDADGDKPAGDGDIDDKADVNGKEDASNKDGSNKDESNNDESSSSKTTLKTTIKTKDNTPTSPGALPSPLSAKSDGSVASTTGLLVGLPTSPRPGMDRFPSRDSLLPGSPLLLLQPMTTTTTRLSGNPGGGASSSSSHKPVDRGVPAMALRTAGQLPLRIYEQPGGPLSPTSAEAQRSGLNIQQTVFTKGGVNSNNNGPMTASLRTPWTGLTTATPYSPYQPFSPVVPMTPTLVTKQDRKRMKKMVPKTPTMEMVKSEEEMW